MLRRFVNPFARAAVETVTAPDNGLLDLEVERRFTRNAHRWFAQECKIEARRERSHFDLPGDWPA